MLYPRAAFNRARALMRSYPASVSCWYRRDDDDDDQGDCRWLEANQGIALEASLLLSCGMWEAGTAMKSWYCCMYGEKEEKIVGADWKGIHI